MKKVFLSFMMIATAMMSFTSCSKSDDDKAISNAFKLHGSTYNLGSAMAGSVKIGPADCTMLLLSKSATDVTDVVGFIFDGTEIQTGDIDLALNQTALHPVMFAVTGNTTTSPEELLAYMNEHAYFSTEGTAKITINGDNIRITTSGVKVTNLQLAPSGQTVGFELGYDGAYTTMPTTSTFTIDGETHNVGFAGQINHTLLEQDYSIAFFCEENPLTATDGTNVVALLFPTADLPVGEYNIHIDPTQTIVSNVGYMTGFKLAEFMADPLATLTNFAFFGSDGELSIQKDAVTSIYTIESEGITLVNKNYDMHYLTLNFNGELVKFQQK